jgi:hypothetical protein
MAASSATKVARQAQIVFGNKGDARAVRVAHPGRLTAKDVASINKYLVDKVIFDLTGCSCLSGTIDVIWERNFENVIQVDLDRVGAPIGR